MIICNICKKKRTYCSEPYQKKTRCVSFEEMTNEEWFCQLPTEEKAKVLGQIAKNAYECCEDGKTNKCVNRHNCEGYCDYGWELWLKEKHE